MVITAMAGKLAPAELNQAHVDAAIELLRIRYAPSTAYNAIGHLRGILEMLRDAGAHKLIARRYKPKNRSTVPTEDELAKMKAAARIWEKAWLILQAELGMRINEARQVCDAIHDPANGTVTIIGKRNHPRTLTTTDELEAIWRIAPPTDDPTTSLLERLAGKRLNAHVMSRDWHKLLRRAGAREKLRPHDLRRRAATQTYARTKDIRAAQLLLGHDRLESTLGYLAHYDPANLKPIIEALRIPTEIKQ